MTFTLMKALENQRGNMSPPLDKRFKFEDLKSPINQTACGQNQEETQLLLVFGSIRSLCSSSLLFFPNEGEPVSERKKTGWGGRGPPPQLVQLSTNRGKGQQPGRELLAAIKGL